jgi:hypothetical protein
MDRYPGLSHPRLSLFSKSMIFDAEISPKRRQIAATQAVRLLQIELITAETLLARLVLKKILRRTRLAASIKPQR